MNTFALPQVLAAELESCCGDHALAGGIKTVCGAGIKLLAEYHQVSATKAMQICLEHDCWPLRFARNAGVFSAKEQSRLLSSHAFVAGCGGLGGYVATLLARAGVGIFTLCDGDVFSESNLNRQLLAREDNIGKNKAEATAEEITAIASHARVNVLRFMLNDSNVKKAVAGVDIIMDCLDSLPIRKLLAKAASEKYIHFVHGAVAGHEGFISLIRPNDDTFHALYGNHPAPEQDCAEHVLGVPTLTPAAAAALQAALALRQLTGKPGDAKMLYHLDVFTPLLDMMKL